MRELWDTAAGAYAEGQASGRDYYRLEFFGPAHIALCGDVQGLRILDVGCGTGYFAREMARRGARVTGVDISPRMLEHAVHAGSQDPLGIRYLVHDAANLLDRFAPGSFDMAASCLALQDMPEIPDVLQALHAVLVPGGRLVASIAHPCTDTPFREWAREASGRQKWLCIDRYFERGSLEGSIWIPGSYVSQSSTRAPNNALPRRLTLCTHAKQPKYRGTWSCETAMRAQPRAPQGPKAFHRLHVHCMAAITVVISRLCAPAVTDACRRIAPLFQAARRVVRLGVKTGSRRHRRWDEGLERPLLDVCRLCRIAQVL